MKRVKMPLVIALVAMVFTGMSSAQSNIVDSMDFQGKEISLSIKNADEIALKNNTDVQKKSIEIDKAKIEVSKMTRELSDCEGRVTMKDNAILYLQAVKTKQLNRDYTESSAKRNYDCSVIKLKSDVEQAYYSELQAEQNLKINADNLKLSKDTYNITKKKYDLGLVAKKDLLDSEANVVKAQKDLDASEIAVKNAKMALNLKLGIDLMSNIKLTDELKYEEYKLGSIAEAVSKAISNRNEIKAAEYASQMKDISCQIELYTGGEKSNPYKTAKFSLDLAQKDVENAKKGIELEVRSDYLDIMQKQNEIKSGQKTIEIAQEGLKIAQVSYDKGMSTLTDLQKAQIGLQQAKLGLSKSILDYKLSVLKYIDSMGVGRGAVSGAAGASAEGPQS